MHATLDYETYTYDSKCGSTMTTNPDGRTADDDCGVTYEPVVLSSQSAAVAGAVGDDGVLKGVV